MKTIAVLITCFNRKKSTLNCLSLLFEQVIPNDTKLRVYLVDDASSDGTADAVAESFPEVELLHGTGSLFWNGGMRLAFDTASKSDPDFFLWLNDDTYIYKDAIGRLLQVFAELKCKNISSPIVVGATQDPSTGEMTYGGVNRYSWWYPLKFTCVEPEETPTQCDTMHGNCVLIPRDVAERVGNLDSNFVHHLSDFDYGFRACQQDCSVWLAPGFIGTCSFHDPSWRDTDISLKESFKRVNTPKGLDLNEWKLYARRHAGMFWPIYWVAPYVKLLFTSLFRSLRRQPLV